MKKRYKYGFLLHEAIGDFRGVLKAQLKEALLAWRDPEVPDLYTVEVRNKFQISDDFGVLFDIDRLDDFDLSQGLFSDQNSPRFSESLLYACEYWNNGGSFYIAPETRQLRHDPSLLPNARQIGLGGDVVLFDYSNYPKKTTAEILSLYKTEVYYFPFEFYVTPPSFETEKMLMESWLAKQQDLLSLALEIFRQEHPNGWAFAPAKSYRYTSFPNFDNLTFVGDEVEAEAYAQRYWHQCYLVNVATGEYVGRWASR